MNDSQRAVILDKTYQAWLIFNPHQSTTSDDVAHWAMQNVIITVKEYEALITGPNVRLDPPQ